MTVYNKAGYCHYFDPGLSASSSDGMGFIFLRAMARGCSFERERKDANICRIAFVSFLLGYVQYYSVLADGIMEKLTGSCR